MTPRPVSAVLSPVPLGSDTTEGPGNTTGTTAPGRGVVLGSDGNSLISWTFSERYYEDYGYYGQSPYVRPRAHVVWRRSIRSPRSPFPERTAFSVSYREREILQRGLRCVCVCSIIPSYPCRIVTEGSEIQVGADLGKGLRSTAGALTTRPGRKRNVPCRFNHCHTVSYLTNQTVTNRHQCRAGPVWSRNGVFCDLYQPIDIQRVSGWAPGRAPGFLTVSKAENEGLGIYSVLAPRTAAREPPRGRPRRGGRWTYACRAGVEKIFRATKEDRSHERDATA